MALPRGGLFLLILQWEKGSYQMKVVIAETAGKLNFKYEFYDLNGELIDLAKFANVSSK